MLFWLKSNSTDFPQFSSIFQENFLLASKNPSFLFLAIQSIKNYLNTIFIFIIKFVQKFIGYLKKSQPYFSLNLSLTVKNVRGTLRGARLHL